MFSVRVVTVNHYLSPPVADLDVKFSDFRKMKVTQVPVIRIFGSTPAGQKTCLHVHGVFPYFYVPCEESEVSEKFLQQLALSIDTALQVGSGNASKYVQHVFKIIPVSGRQLYGYLSAERHFLKIYFYNPFVIRRASELLQNGAILNRVFQPYECHVPFHLQFFIDYNLYGMNLVNLAVVKFRRCQTDGKAPTQSNINHSQLGESTMFNSVSTQHWSPCDIPESQWLPDDVKRQSTCELEVDGVATDILNRLDLKDNMDTNPGLVAIWEDERQRREQLDQLSQLMPPASPERGEMKLQEAEGDWLERLTEVVDEQLKELEEHLPVSEGGVSRKEDTEEAASQSVLNQLPDHLSQDADSQPKEGNVEAVVDEVLAMSLSQVSVTGLSQAADKDLANLLMELGQGDDIDSDSILSTQTPAGSQETGDSQTDGAVEEEEDAEKQESLEMSQVWLREDDVEEDEDEDREVEKTGKQEHNSSREESLIPDVEEMSAFSQPELRSSQLPQLDGPNDPIPEKRRKKSKLQMVQEMRAIRARASHQLTRSLPGNFNPPSEGYKPPSFSHSLNFGGTNMNRSANRKELNRKVGKPSSTYSQEHVGLYSQNFQQDVDHPSFQNRSQNYFKNPLFNEHVGGSQDGQKTVVPRKGRPPGALKLTADGFGTTGSQQYKNTSHGGSPLPSAGDDLNQDAVVGRNASISEKNVEKTPGKKRGRPPLSSKLRKDSLQGKESVPKKNAKDKNEPSTLKSKSMGHSWHSVTTSAKKTTAKKGRLPSSSKHEVGTVADSVSKEQVDITGDDPVQANFKNGPDKKLTSKPGRPPKKIKIQFVGSLSGNTEVIKTLNDKGDAGKVLICNKISDEDSSLERRKMPQSLKIKKVDFQSRIPTISNSPNELVIISDEKSSAGESSDLENIRRTFAVKKRRGRPPLLTKKQTQGTVSSPEGSHPRLDALENEEKSFASVKESELNLMHSPNAKPAKRRGRPPSKWKRKKEIVEGQRSQLVFEGGGKESGVLRVNDAFQKGTSVTVKSGLSDTSCFEGQGSNQRVQRSLSIPEEKSSDSLRASPVGVKEISSGRKTLGLAQRKPRKRGRPPLSLKKKGVNVHQQYLADIPIEEDQYKSSYDRTLEIQGDVLMDRSSCLTTMSGENSDDTFQGRHSKGSLSLKKLKVKLTKVNLSQEQEETFGHCHGDVSAEEHFGKGDNENVHEDSPGQNDMGLGEVTDLTDESLDERPSDEHTRKICESKNTRPRHLGMRRSHSHLNKFARGNEVLVAATDVEINPLSMNAGAMPRNGAESNPLIMKESSSSSDVIAKDFSNVQEVSSGDTSKSAKDGSISEPLCLENHVGNVKSSAITKGGKRHIGELEEDVRKTKCLKKDEEMCTNTPCDIQCEEVTKEKHSVFPSELREGQSINLNEFTSEQLSSMAVISPKIILYRFGKSRSSPLPSACDEDTESQSTPEIEKNSEMHTQTEIAATSSRDYDKKVSPLLHGIALQKKYIPANSKAAQQRKVSEKRGGERVEYSLLAGFKRHAKRKKQSLQSPSEIQSQADGKGGDQSEVIDLTSSSPDGTEKSSPQEVEILGFQDQKRDSLKKSDRQPWTPSLSSGTKKKSRLSTGSRSKKKGIGKSPGSSPSLKPQLQFFFTPSKADSSKSPKSSQSSKSSRKSSQNTPQSSQQNASQTPKRGRGRPRKLKLDGGSQADDKGKQNKEIRDYFPVTKRGGGGNVERSKQEIAGDKEEDEVTQEDAEDEVSFLKFLPGENAGNVNITSQETQLDEIIDLLNDDDVSAILTVEKEIEVTSTPCATDEDAQAIDSKETSGSDPKYPFMRTPSGSPYRDVLWNLSFTSPAVSSPRESPPKYWSPTDDTNKGETCQSESSDQNMSCELLKSDSETQFIDSLDQNSNKEGYSGYKDESEGDGRETPSLSVSEIEYDNSQIALFEELHTTTASEETFKERKTDLLSNIASDDTGKKESRVILSDVAPPERGPSEQSNGETHPKSTALLPEGQTWEKTEIPEDGSIDKVTKNDATADSSDKISNVKESEEKAKDNVEDGDDDHLLPFPTTIPDSVSEASESDEDSSPLELMDSVSQIELLQSQLVSEKGTSHVSHPAGVTEGDEAVGKSELDETTVQKSGDGLKDSVQTESIDEKEGLSGRDEKSGGEGSPVIDFQGTETQAKLLGSLNDSSVMSHDGETSCQESRGGVKSTNKDKRSNNDDDSDVKDGNDDGLQHEETSKEDEALVDEKSESNRGLRDDSNIFEVIGSLYKIPKEKSISDGDGKKSETGGNVMDKGQGKGFLDGTSSPVLEYQLSTTLAKMPSLTAESEETNIDESDRSKDEDDKTRKRGDTNEMEESFSSVGGSSPVLEFQGSSSQMNSLQNVEDQKVEDLSEKMGEEQKSVDLNGKADGGGTDLSETGKTDSSGMRKESASDQSHGGDKKGEIELTEDQSTEDKVGEHGEESSDLKGGELEADKITKSVPMPCLNGGEMSPEQLEVKVDDVSSIEENRRGSKEITDHRKKTDVLDCHIPKKDELTAVAANQNDEMSHVSPGGIESEKSEVTTSDSREEQTVREVAVEMTAGESEILNEMDEVKKNDVDTEVILEGKVSDEKRRSADKIKNDDKSLLEESSENSESLSSSHSHHQSSILMDRISEMGKEKDKSSAGTNQEEDGSKSSEVSSVFLKFQSKNKKSSDLSNKLEKYSENNQSEVQRNSCDGSTPIDLSQYGIEKELNIPLRRLSLDDLPQLDRSGTSYCDSDDWSRRKRRPVLDFESTFMIEHSQFQLSDSSEHNKAHPCDLRDLETSLNLRDSEISDFDESSEDFQKSNRKSKQKKGKKELTSKKKNKKDKEKKKKRRKSESDRVGRKKRKSDSIGGTELSSQEIEDYPPIKMVFRKVRHKKEKTSREPQKSKKEITQSRENWKLTERVPGAKEIVQPPDIKIPNLGGDNLRNNEQFQELRTLILRRVNANCTGQKSPRENIASVSNKAITHDVSQGSVTDSVSNELSLPLPTHKQIKELELKQSLKTDIDQVGPDTDRQGIAMLEEHHYSVGDSVMSNSPNNKETACKDATEPISTDWQDHLKSDKLGLQNVGNTTLNDGGSNSSDKLSSTEARIEHSEIDAEICDETVTPDSFVGNTAVVDGKSNELERENKDKSMLGVADSKDAAVTTKENMQTSDIDSDSSAELVFNTRECSSPGAVGKVVVESEVQKNGKSHMQGISKLDISMRSRLNTAETEVIEALMGLSNDGGTLSTRTEPDEDADDSHGLAPSLVGFTEEEAHELECATSLLEESTKEMRAVPTGEDENHLKREQVLSNDQQVEDESHIVGNEMVVDPVKRLKKEGSEEIPAMEDGCDDACLAGIFIPVKPPPTREDISSSLREYGLTDVVHQVSYWEKNADIPAFVRETANMQVRLNENLPEGLKEALPPSSSEGLDHWRTEMFVRNQSQMLDSEEGSFYSEEGKAIMKGILESASCKMEVVFTPCKLPPSVCDITKWLKNQSNNKSLVIPKSATSRSTTLPNQKSNELNGENVQNRVDDDAPSYTEDAPPSPFLQELIDQVEPSTPPLIDTPESPPSRSSSEALPCHSTPITTGVKDRPTQPTLTPILVTAPKKTEPRLKKRVSLADVPKMKPPKVVTPGQASMATPLIKKGAFTSQLEGVTPKNTAGFKFSQSNLQDAKALHENQHLTLMSLELHVHTRGKLRPDPDFDPIRAIFFCIASENYGEGVGDGAQSEYAGVITVDNPNKNRIQTPASNRPLMSTYGLPDLKVINASDEMEMFEKFIELVQSHDPDFLVGYEIQQFSWGYLLDRASALDVKLCSRISRLPEFEKESHSSSEKDAYGSDHTSEIHIAGRIVLNVWRLLRHEIALNVYTFENVAYHILHQRVPLFSFQDLSAWYDHQTHLLRWRVVEHYMYRVIGNLKILKKTDMIGRTSELARVFGIEFFSVLSRGTQYRVESMMLRQAKAQNYVALSPSVQQRAVMKAPECLPLILEPESRLYEDPVIVLDFQSLYPSMMIGYNYCFSTCIGRVEHIAKGGHFVLGCTTHYLPPKQIKQLLDSGGLHISPNGVVFVKKSVRHGILPRMLEQILQTRIMVKKGLKDHKEDKVLQRMLDNRQLGLKLIANVTYGYTSASFSGRMPCIEVGDSIVMKARETLERSIHLIDTTPKWGARVVYGDTDSMFVMVKGATKERAFEVGNEIVAAVSKVNPKPVKLKLEKVYKPCVLQAKKRYVGFKYESPDQKEPELEAKGIETIRRDTCPAVAKILEKSLKIIFTTQNVSQVKQYVQTQFQKIIDGRMNQQDLVFAKEYRGRQYYRPGACIPALELTKRSLAVDRRSEPRVGERVPYVIVNGIPGLPLIQLVRRPEELASDPTLILNSAYYITRQLVPSLNRVFGIMGVETLQWYQELPRNLRVTSAPTTDQSNQSKKGTISQYFCSLNCVICDQLTKTGLCEDCRIQPQLAAAALNRKIQEYQRAWIHLTKICRNCTGFPEHRPSCISIDCPNRFKVVKSSQKMDTIPHLVQLLSELPAS